MSVRVNPLVEECGWKNLTIRQVTMLRWFFSTLVNVVLLTLSKFTNDIVTGPLKLILIFTLYNILKVLTLNLTNVKEYFKISLQFKFYFDVYTVCQINIKEK